MRSRSLRLLRDQSKAREGFNRGIDGNRRGAPTLVHNCDHFGESEIIDCGEIILWYALIVNGDTLTQPESIDGRNKSSRS